jgi:hypothetical protein
VRLLGGAKKMARTLNYESLYAVTRGALMHRTVGPNTVGKQREAMAIKVIKTAAESGSGFRLRVKASWI